MWAHYAIRLDACRRGFHLITDDVISGVTALTEIHVGMLHLQLQHTSASLCINENYDPDVRHDLEAWVNQIAPEHAPYFKHTLEGPDDMPAHIKAMLFGTSLSIPVKDGSLALGTWQGIYLGEHRDHGGRRTIVATLNGE